MAKRKEPAKKTTAKENKGRGKLDEAQVRKIFESPDGFMSFLQRLPPSKTIMHPASATKSKEEVVGSESAYWVALSWYLRDSLGFDRYDDPDRVIGPRVEHHYGPNNTQMQSVLLPSNRWIMECWFPYEDHHSIRADQLAAYMREALVSVG